MKGPNATRTDSRPAAAASGHRERLIFPSVARDTVRPVAPDLSAGRHDSQWPTVNGPRDGYTAEGEGPSKEREDPHEDEDGAAIVAVLVVGSLLVSVAPSYAWWHRGWWSR